MNGKDIFWGLSYINRRFIDEAEVDTVCEHAKVPSGKHSTQERPLKHSRFPRPLLIAALIAVLLLLVGCGAVIYLTVAVEPWASIPKVESAALPRADIQTAISAVSPGGIQVQVDIEGFGSAEKSVIILENAPCTVERKTDSGWEVLAKKTEDTQQNAREVLTYGHYDLQINWLAAYGYLDEGSYRVTAQLLDGHDPFAFEFEIRKDMRTDNVKVAEALLSRECWHIRETVNWEYGSLDRVPEEYMEQFQRPKEGDGTQSEYWKCAENYLYLTYRDETIRNGMLYRDGTKYKLIHEQDSYDSPTVGWMPWPGMDMNRLSGWTACLEDEQYKQDLTYRADGTISEAVLSRTEKGGGDFGVDIKYTVTLEFLDTARDEIAQMIQKQNTNVWKDFSWEKDRKRNKALDVSFVNTTPNPIHSTAEALALAEKECTVEYNQIMVYRDEAAGIWKIEYQILYGYQGCQYVYLNDDGITVMVSGAGSKVEVWKDTYPDP